MRCRLCDAPDATTLFTRTDHTFIALGRPFRYAKCGNCGVHFLVDDDLPADIYHLEKQHTRGDAPDEKRYVHWDDDIVARLAARVPPRNGATRFLDFGSGYGDMLIAAIKAGYQAEGSDISPVFAEEARKSSGKPVFVGQLEDARFPDRSFGVVNAHFVLEYVPTLRATFRELSRLLAPNGVLRICSYTTDSVAARLRGSNWWNYTPTRRFLLSLKTIRWLAGESGLRVVDVIHGGEQSEVKYLAERPEAARTGRRVAIDRARYRLERVVIAGQSMSSCRAFYLTQA